MKIICLGDSLTSGFQLHPKEGWVSLLWQETGIDWINAGIHGDTAMGMLVRLQTEVLPQNPDAVLLLGGDNDILLTGSADQAKSCMMAMIHQCVAKGVKPIVGIQFPIMNMPEMWQEVAELKAAQAALAEYIRWLRALAHTLSLRSVDFAAAFAAVGDPMELYLPDGIHPSAKGCRIMADTVKRSRMVS